MAPTLSAHTLAHTIAVNCHTTFGGTAEGDISQDAAALASLGVRHVRASLAAPQSTISALSVAGMQQLAAIGVGFLQLLDGPPGYASNQGSTAFVPADIFNLVQSAGLLGACDGWEMPNEPDNASVPDWPARNVAWAKQILAALKTDSAWATKPVLGPAFVGGVPAGQAFRAAGAAGLAPALVGDSHPYRGGLTPCPSALAAEAFAPLYAWAPATTRCWATEVGYSTAPPGASGQPPVSEAVQAEYTLRTILEHARAGIVRTSLYQLADNFPENASSDGEDYYGLYRNDWTPKPAAVAVKNLLALTGDIASPIAAAAPVTVTVAGFTPDAPDTLNQIADALQTLVVRTSRHTTQIWVWRTASVWDRVAYAPLTPSSQALRLSTPGLAWTTARIHFPTGDAQPYDLPVSDGFASFCVAGDVLMIELS